MTKRVVNNLRKSNMAMEFNLIEDSSLDWRSSSAFERSGPSGPTIGSGLIRRFPLSVEVKIQFIRVILIISILYK
jgi:hypothetical protein